MAQVVRIAPGAPAAYAEAVDRYLGSAGVAESSRRIYRISLTTWAWLLAGEQPPARRRGARPPDLQLALLDEPRLPARLATSFMLRSTSGDADTLNRELSVLRAALAWWQAQGWIAADPSRGMSRLPVPPDRTRGLTRAEVDAVFRLDVALREKTYWRLLYESAARADEVLTLDVGDLDLRNKRARVVAKGGAVEWIHWQSGAAHLLPRLLRGRQAGPVFLTDRRAPSRTPALDVCPITGRARLSPRRAAELFTEATRTLDSTGEGWTLHQLRHSDLTHEADEGASTPMLLVRSRHASVRSLERYAGPGVDRSDLVRLRRARDQMDREYARPLDVEALAHTACMSSGHFSRSFRAAFGETPYSYLMTRRIERAMALLRRGDLSVTEVCFEVGCASLGSFSARFTELVGETPSAYRAHDHSWTEPLPACLVRAALRPVRNREAATTGDG